MKKYILRHLIIWFLLLVTLSYLVYLLIPISKTFEYGEVNGEQIKEFKIVSPEIFAGARLYWLANACRYTNYPFEGHRFIINQQTGVRYDLAEISTKSVISEDSCDTVERNVLIPAEVMSGIYRMYTETTIYFPLFKKEHVFFKTEEFKINEH